MKSREGVAHVRAGQAASCGVLLRVVGVALLWAMAVACSPAVGASLDISLEASPERVNATSAASKGDNSSISFLYQQPSMLMALRVNRIQELGHEAGRLLESISGRTLAESPADTLIGSILRNPSLEGLQKKAFLEAVWFAARGTEGPSCVYAFPVADVAAYVHYLVSRDGVRSQNANGIITMQESGSAEGDLFLTTAQERLILYGTNRRAVELARELYRVRASGMFENEHADICFHLHCKRLAAIYAQEIEQGYHLLAQNVCDDLTASGFFERSVISRMITRAIASWRDGLDHVRLVVLRASLDSKGVRCDGVVEWDQGDVSTLLSGVDTNHSTLARSIPEDAVSAECSFLPYKAVGLLLESLFNVLTAGLDSASGQDVRNILDGVSGKLLALEPLESIHAVLPITDAGEASALVAWRLGHPEALDAAVDAVVRLAEKTNSVRQILEQRSILLNIEQKPIVVGRIPARALIVTVKQAVADDPIFGKTESVIFHREYLLAQNGPVLFMTTGHDAHARLQWALSTVRAGASSPAFVKESLAIHPAAMWVGMVRPSAMIASAARLFMAQTKRTERRETVLDVQKHLAPFLNAREGTLPFSAAIFTVPQEDATGFLVDFPVAPLQALYNLCLRTIPQTEVE